MSPTGDPPAVMTHVAVRTTKIDESVDFYRRYAGLHIVHEREDDGIRVVWLSHRREDPDFVFVLLEMPHEPNAEPGATDHFGLAVESREQVDRIAELARSEGMDDWRPSEVEWRWVERGWEAAKPGESSLWRAWARPREPLRDDPALHEAALAFLSDFGSHWSVVRRLGEDFVWDRFASLDQGLWVHGPVNWNDWWLVVSRSDVALEGHTFTRRQIFDQHGRLLASGSQEGLHSSSG